MNPAPPRDLLRNQPHSSLSRPRRRVSIVPATLGLVVLLSIACGGATPPLPTQRLCEPGQTTAAWLDAQLAEREAQQVLDELVLGAPTVFCHPDGREETRELTWVVVRTLKMDGDVVLEEQAWLEKGAMPRMDPRAASWHVRPTATEPPLEWKFTGRRR